MLKLEFSDKKIKKLYDKIVNENHFLEEIIDQLMNEYKENVLIMDTVIDEKGFQIIIKVGEDNITLKIDYLKCKTYLICPNWDHVTIYSNILRKNYVPIGKEYCKNNRSLLRIHPDETKPHKYIYKIFEDNIYSEYEINIRCDLEKDIIDDKIIINTLLSDKTKITRLKDLLDLMNQLLDLKKCEIKIKDNYDSESIVIISYGTLTKYDEYIEGDEVSYKIYFEDGVFYKDTIKNEEIDDSFIPYVKKKGKRNG